MAREAKNTDEFFQRIHDALPGFAGLTFEDGIPTVYLVDTARADLARSVLTPFFVGRGRAGFRVREAGYSWAELYDWRRRARQMFDMPDLRSLGVSASSNRLEVGVRVGGDAEAVRTRLHELGVNLEAVEVGEIAEVELMTGLADRHRPVMGGLHITSCTLGANVLWDTLRTYLTADHCGAPVWQDTTGAEKLIGGQTVASPPTYTCTPQGQSQTFSNCRHSDAKLIQYEDSVDWSFGHIARPLYSGQWSGSTNFERRFWITDSYYVAVEDETLHKVGYKTGWTTGPINKTCEDRRAPGGPWNICQVGVLAGADHGDSGAPVFRMGTYGKVMLAGILWGGLADTLFYSPLSNIEEDFGGYIDVITDSIPVLPSGVSISGPTAIRPGATCLWQGSVSDGTEPFTYHWENDTYSVGTTDSYEGGMLPGGSGSSFVLKFTVTNDAGQGYDQITVTEDPNAPLCVF